jgi:hypothetical protein
MTIFTAYFECFVRATFEFDTETPEQALELARAKYNEDSNTLYFDHHDTDYYPPIQEIDIRGEDLEPTGVCWQTSPHRRREASFDLLNALEGLTEFVERYAYSVDVSGYLEAAHAAIAKARGNA